LSKGKNSPYRASEERGYKLFRALRLAFVAGGKNTMEGETVLGAAPSDLVFGFGVNFMREVSEESFAF
jgi:hypothetical protein